MNAPTRAYLSLGSNMGDRLANLVGAIGMLEDKRRGTAVTHLALSPVYETAPIGSDGWVVDDQPPFLNCGVALDTRLSAVALRAMCARVERAFGRTGGERWRPRPIDIDLALFGDQQIALPELTVPHPRMLEREFVLRPLVDLDPDVSAPGVGRLAPVLIKLPRQGCVLHTPARALEALVRARRPA